MKLGKINKLSIVNNAYVSVLQNIPTPPTQLYVAGNIPTERRPTVAIVGSRKPTAYGIDVTHRLAFELAKRGVVIVSGLAYGIDAIARHGVSAVIHPGGSIADKEIIGAANEHNMAMVFTGQRAFKH